MIDDARALDLRDRYLAAREGRLDDDALRALRDDIDACDAPPVTLLEGLEISHHPSARFKTLRFVEEALIPEAHRHRFAHPSPDAPTLVATFADPVELHFRTFENILPLDRLLDAFDDVAVSGLTRVAPEVDAWTFSLQLSHEARAQLSRLDALGLYVEPLNAVSRGGRRFIFHAAALAHALTEALRPIASTIVPGWLWGQSFHVNPVFRCNRFEPGDAPFRRHHDAPYHDPAQRHISHHTLLLYLTGGRGDPALSIDDARIDALAPLTGALFDQRYAHEGAAYLDGPKVFLRTELVFEQEDCDESPDVARLFASACYLASLHTVLPELARFTDDRFDLVARAHHEGLPRGEAPEEVFVHTRFRGVDYVANGFDFWFRAGQRPLIECAALALLDYLNCRVDGRAFRAQCEHVAVRGRRDSAWIPRFLADRARAVASPFETAETFDIEGLFPPHDEPEWPSKCGDHDLDFDASRSGDVINTCATAQEDAREDLLRASVFVMGDALVLNPSRFVVRDGRIHVLSTQRLAPIHFAGGHNCVHHVDTERYLAPDVVATLPFELVPPILFTEREGCYHLMLDLFRNGWMASYLDETVTIPRIQR